MSKRMELKCRIVKADPDILEKALNNMLKFYDGRLVRHFNGDSFRLQCGKLGIFGTNIKVKNGQITVEGYDDDNETQNVKQAIENFYTATMFEEEFNSPIEMDEKGDLILNVEV
jgi:hypothetical protein